MSEKSRGRRVKMPLGCIRKAGSPLPDGTVASGPLNSWLGTSGWCVYCCGPGCQNGDSGYIEFSNTQFTISQICVFPIHFHGLGDAIGLNSEPGLKRLVQDHELPRGHRINSHF